MEGPVSDVAVCNLAFTGRLEELRALLLRDRTQATRADQVSRLRSRAAWGRLPAGRSCKSLLRSPLPSRRITAPRCTGPARRDIRTSQSSSSGLACL